MKRSILLLALVLIAVPAFAQDEGGGFGGFLGGIGDSPRGGNSPAVDRLVQLRKILLDAKTPLTADQDKSLNTLITNDVKKYITDLEKRFPTEVASARTTGQPQGGGDRGGFGGAAGFGAAGGGARGGAPAGGRGGRGGGAGAAIAPNSPLGMEMRRINEELQSKVIGALKPEQQQAFQKYQADQIKKAGGFPGLRLTMEEAGTPLTPEQEVQIEPLYTALNQQIAQLRREGNGNPDPAKMGAANNDMILKLLKILNTNQKKTMTDSMKKQAPQK